MRFQKFSGNSLLRRAGRLPRIVSGFDQFDGYAVFAHQPGDPPGTESDSLDRRLHDEHPFGAQPTASLFQVYGYVAQMV
jgi:hypothetical protein